MRGRGCMCGSARWHASRRKMARRVAAGWQAAPNGACAAACMVPHGCAWCRVVPHGPRTRWLAWRCIWSHGGWHGAAFGHMVAGMVPACCPHAGLHGNASRRMVLLAHEYRLLQAAVCQPSTSLLEATPSLACTLLLARAGTQPRAGGPGGRLARPGAGPRRRGCPRGACARHGSAPRLHAPAARGGRRRRGRAAGLAPTVASCWGCCSRSEWCVAVFAVSFNYFFLVWPTEAQARAFHTCLKTKTATAAAAATLTTLMQKASLAAVEGLHWSGRGRQRGQSAAHHGGAGAAWRALCPRSRPAAAGRDVLAHGPRCSCCAQRRQRRAGRGASAEAAGAAAAIGGVRHAARAADAGGARRRGRGGPGALGAAAAGPRGRAAPLHRGLPARARRGAPCGGGRTGRR
eukprot:365849-Chlamydomonas_euryale.AAC.4